MKSLLKYFDSEKAIDIFHVCSNVIKYGYPTHFLISFIMASLRRKFF